MTSSATDGVSERMRPCICADPENCREIPPNVRCKKLEAEYQRLLNALDNKTCIRCDSPMRRQLMGTYVCDRCGP